MESRSIWLKFNKINNNFALFFSRCYNLSRKIEKGRPMLSVIEVKCPHCGVRGQIVLPPLGSLIMGPCPKCQELVLVFCGRALPVDKTIMYEGSFVEKHDHLMGILMDALEKSVNQLSNEVIAPDEEEREESELLDIAGGPLDAPVELSGTAPTDSQETSPITSAEVQHFIDIDLKRIDNCDYFRSIFNNAR